MELLLNLIWVALASGAFLVFLRRQHEASHGRVSYRRSLLALMCVVLLLFPVVSASDDLHPSQALLEDASKRIQHFYLLLQSSPGGSAGALLPAMLSATFLLALQVWPPRRDSRSTVCVLRGYFALADGRAPPFCCV